MAFGVEVLGRRVAIVQSSAFSKGTVVSYFRSSPPCKNEDEDVSEKRSIILHRIKFDDGTERQYSDLEKELKDHPDTMIQIRDETQARVRKYNRNVLGRRVEIEVNLAVHGEAGRTASYPGTVKRYSIIGNTGHSYHHVVQFDNGSQGFYTRLEDMEEDGTLHWIESDATEEHFTYKPNCTGGHPQKKIKSEFPTREVTPSNSPSVRPRSTRSVTNETPVPVCGPTSSSDHPPPTHAPTQVKKEKEQECVRKYGDRVLLNRQAKDKKTGRPLGMMKLGGGNVRCSMNPSAIPPDRSALFGDLKVFAFNDFSNPNAPKYAGQKNAAVRTGLMDRHDVTADEPFVAFVKRSVDDGKKHYFGWEYCGTYKIPHGCLSYHLSAHDMKESSKQKRLYDIMKSLKTPNGFWQGRIMYWKAKLLAEMQKRSDPAAPQYLIEGREPTREEKNAKTPSLAARARALGISEDLTKEELARKLVHLDELYEEDVVEFVEYDEEMYDFVKHGETSKNKYARDRKNRNEPAATASDWYHYLDTGSLPDEEV